LVPVGHSCVQTSSGTVSFVVIKYTAFYGKFCDYKTRSSMTARVKTLLNYHFFVDDVGTSELHV